MTILDINGVSSSLALLAGICYGKKCLVHTDKCHSHLHDVIFEGMCLVSQQMWVKTRCLPFRGLE